MFDSIPIEKRLRYILVLMGLALVVSLLYGLQVLDIYEKISELEKKVQVVEDADLEIVNRQVVLKQLGEEIANLQASGRPIESHAAFIAYADSLCGASDLSLVSMPVETVEVVGGYRIARIEFSVEGLFENINSLIYRLEQIDRIGSLDHAHIERRTIRIRNVPREIIVASLRVNRLVNE